MPYGGLFFVAGYFCCRYFVSTEADFYIEYSINRTQKGGNERSATILLNPYFVGIISCPRIRFQIIESNNPDTKRSPLKSRLNFFCLTADSQKFCYSGTEIRIKIHHHVRMNLFEFCFFRSILRFVQTCCKL